MNMARLPQVELPTKVVTIADQDIEIKSLTRSQVIKISTDYKQDVDAAEVFILACGTGQPEEDIRAWRDSTDATTVGVLVDAIVYLSALATESNPNPN